MESSCFLEILNCYEISGTSSSSKTADVKTEPVDEHDKTEHKPDVSKIRSGSSKVKRVGICRSKDKNTVWPNLLSSHRLLFYYYIAFWIRNYRLVSRNDQQTIIIINRKKCFYIELQEKDAKEKSKKSKSYRRRDTAESDDSDASDGHESGGDGQDSEQDEQDMETEHKEKDKAAEKVDWLNYILICCFLVTDCWQWSVAYYNRSIEQTHVLLDIPHLRYDISRSSPTAVRGRVLQRPKWSSNGVVSSRPIDRQSRRQQNDHLTTGEISHRMPNDPRQTVTTVNSRLPDDHRTGNRGDRPIDITIGTDRDGIAAIRTGTVVTATDPRNDPRTVTHANDRLRAIDPVTVTDIRRTVNGRNTTRRTKRRRSDRRTRWKRGWRGWGRYWSTEIRRSRLMTIGRGTLNAKHRVCPNRPFCGSADGPFTRNSWNVKFHAEIKNFVVWNFL